jgi:hypothetical protein
VELELFHADKHDKANRCFSDFVNVPNKGERMKKVTDMSFSITHDCHAIILTMKPLLLATPPPLHLNSYGYP